MYVYLTYTNYVDTHTYIYTVYIDISMCGNRVETGLVWSLLGVTKTLRLSTSMALPFRASLAPRMCPLMQVTAPQAPHATRHASRW